jgi:hypothetical protein
VKNLKKRPQQNRLGALKRKSPVSEDSRIKHNDEYFMKRRKEKAPLVI